MIMFLTVTLTTIPPPFGLNQPTKPCLEGVTELKLFVKIEKFVLLYMSIYFYFFTKI